MTAVLDQLRGAFASYKRGVLPGGYVRVEGLNYSDGNTGLFTEVYIKDNSIIVSFRGTDDAADASCNLGMGWPQYEKNRSQVQAIIDRAANLGGQVHLTGHSLGGAITQFALYEYALRDPANLRSISFSTWNSLGGCWGLRGGYGDLYDNSSLSQFDGYHYIHIKDFVGRLGGDHVGGRTVMLSSLGNERLSLIEAHGIAALKQSLEQGTHEGRPDYISISEFGKEFVCGISQFLLKNNYGKIKETIDNFKNWPKEQRIEILKDFLILIDNIQDKYETERLLPPGWLSDTLDAVMMGAIQGLEDVLRNRLRRLIEPAVIDRDGIDLVARTDEDAVFAELHVRMDADGGGETDAGELLAMAPAGLGSIDLRFTTLSSTPEGNRIHEQSTFEKTSGKAGTVADGRIDVDNALTLRDAASSGEPIGDARPGMRD
ncbi:hypothetical protein ABLE91_08000 [Aquabacter sp. CN5-332]|uniref:hypothetical protein n=1 Tax=Aquabacter sp. CN5-332 TaxID=3156608 RepID=UPI0032B564EA